MPLYAWVTPAFIPKGSPVDHTWVTSYDSRIHRLSSISDVKRASENYWYCWGDFHPLGRLNDPIVKGFPSAGGATCLVAPNISKSRGTVHWYGIDGVCHQVSNQVLYVTSTPARGKPQIVSGARGYKLSSALFGTYGRREKDWDVVRKNCGIAPSNIHRRRGVASLLSRRMAYFLNFSIHDRRVLELEQRRRQLLAELDEIGFAARTANETTQSRVSQMNGRINSFLQFVASESFDGDMGFMRVFGIHPEEDIYLIDPLLFEFPDTLNRPDRSNDVGW